MSKSEPPSPSVEQADVFVVRDQRVMLDSRVAAAFGTETKRINEAVARNPEKFDQRHAFQLTASENEALKSQAATSKPGRGGARHLPRVFTIKGVARLATILNTPAALRATDLIIDTFLAVQEQLSRGRRTVALPEPERYRPAPEQAREVARLRTKLASALSRLLDTIVDVEQQRTVRQTTQALSSSALANVRERLRTKGLANAKLEADTGLVLAQAEKVLAETRKTNAEAEGVDIANFERRIAAVKSVAELIRHIEPDELVGLIESFEAEPLRLQSPSTRKSPEREG